MKKINPILLLAGGAVLAHFTTKGNGIFGIGAVNEARLKNQLDQINGYFNKVSGHNIFDLEKEGNKYKITSTQLSYFVDSMSKKELSNYMYGMAGVLRNRELISKLK